MSTASNGHAPVSLPDSDIDPLDEEIGRLNDLLGPLAAQADQLRAQLAQVDERAKRIKAAVTALTPKPVRKVGGARPPVAGPSTRAQDWSPSEDTIAKVHAALKEAGETNITALSKRSDMTHSRDTITRAIGVLRERDMARLVRGGNGRLGNVYAAMPDE